MAFQGGGGVYVFIFDLANMFQRGWLNHHLVLIDTLSLRIMVQWNMA